MHHPDNKNTSLKLLSRKSGKCQTRETRKGIKTYKKLSMTGFEVVTHGLLLLFSVSNCFNHSKPLLSIDKFKCVIFSPLFVTLKAICFPTIYWWM